MKRHRNYARAPGQGSALRGGGEYLDQPACKMWLTLQSEHGFSQCAFVNTAGASGSERLVLTTPAAHLIQFLARHGSVGGGDAAFPADRFVIGKDSGSAPTLFTSNTERT